MLAIGCTSMGFAPAPAALRALARPAVAPLMRQSEALPFLECPAALDGSMPGDAVSQLP